jgi:hypothetical protein
MTISTGRAALPSRGLGQVALVALLALMGSGCGDMKTQSQEAPARKVEKKLRADGVLTELLSDGQEAVSGELLVRTRVARDELGAQAIASLHQRLGASVRHAYRSIEGLELVALPGGLSVEEAVAAYSASSHVL